MFYDIIAKNKIVLKLLRLVSIQFNRRDIMFKVFDNTILKILRYILRAMCAANLSLFRPRLFR